MFEKWFASWRKSQERSPAETDSTTPRKFFAEEWVLDLKVPAPQIVIHGTSISSVLHQLRAAYEMAQTAVTYFPDGKYHISCEGDMRRIDESEAFEPSDLMLVEAAIDFDDLPYSTVIKQNLATRLSGVLEKAKDCRILDVHAHGTGRQGEKIIPNLMPRFATRDGKLIVESY